MATITISQTTGTLNADNNFILPITFTVSGLTAYARCRVAIETRRVDSPTYGILAQITESVDESGNGTLSYTINASNPDLQTNGRFGRNSELVFRGRIVDSGATVVTEDLTVTLDAPPLLKSSTIVSDWAANPQVYIAGITTATLTAEFTPQFGATMSSATMRLIPGGQIAMTENDGVWTASTPNTVSNPYILIEALDSRGQRFQGGGHDITVKAHTAPTITYEVFRCDSNGDKDMGGEYMSVTVWATPNPTDLSISTLRITLRDADSVNTWTNSSAVSGTTYIMGEGSISPDTSYVLQVNAEDNYQLSAQVTDNIPAVVRVINVKDGGTGIAFGKLATVANRTDSLWDINTDGEYLVGGQPLIDSLPFATETQAGIVSTGAQKFAGDKTFTGIVTAQNTSANGAILSFKFSDKSNANAAYVWTGAGNNGGQLHFREFSGNSSGLLSNWEQYNLPAPNEGRTGNYSYNIHTTKTYQNTQTLVITVNANTAKSFTVSTGSWGMVVISATTDTYKGISIFNSTSSGVMSISNVKVASSVPITTSTNNLTFTNNGAANAKIAIMMFTGTVS